MSWYERCRSSESRQSGKSRSLTDIHVSVLTLQAAVKASRDGSPHVGLNHFEWAKGRSILTNDMSPTDLVDRILMGAERKSHYVTEESKKMTAYHEGGHALVALHTAGAMPLHKVYVSYNIQRQECTDWSSTIMPRGQALGITFQLPEQDKG